MKIINLNPNQIITLNDYPIRNEQILKLYFRMAQGENKLVPPCPVIHKDLVINNFDTELRTAFNKFYKRNTKAEYFLLDGSHKTTALNLAHKKISAIVFESDKDIQEARKLVGRGELISLTTEKDIKREIKELKKHFNKNKRFETVKEKTNRLVKDKKVPKYMVSSFRGRGR